MYISIGCHFCVIIIYVSHYKVSAFIINQALHLIMIFVVKILGTFNSLWRRTWRHSKTGSGSDWLSQPANHKRRNQSNSFVLSTHAECTSCIIFKMSAVSVYPMCVRASRGLLRLRQGARGSTAPTALDVTRALSADTSSSSATGGLAQAILQERLQQQQKSQVSAMTAWHSCMTGY